MARPPEISEKSIIQAGLELESMDKLPNPGAIRAHLGYRGGLLRIKAIWEAFIQKRDRDFLQEIPSEIMLDALPDAYSANSISLMNKVSNALEQLIIEAYINSQQLFEKRLKALEQTENKKLEHYIASEKYADKSITRLENELDDLQQELERLADQNAKLVIENAEFRGRLAVFDSSFNTHHESRQAQEKKA